MSDVLTPEEVAERWRVRRRTVLGKVRDGTLAKLPLGRVIRIPRWSVEDGLLRELDRPSAA